MVRKFVKSSGDTMILPKDHGGLGIGSVLAMNKALFLGIGVKESNEEELIVVIKALELSSSSSNLTLAL